MALPIFGAGNKGNPGNTIIGGSSMPREKKLSDLKLSSRKPKSDMPMLPTRNDTGKIIAGRTTP